MQKITLILFASILGFSAAAQSAPASTKAEATSAITPSQHQAAEALLNSIYTEASFNQIIDQTLAVQIKSHPEMKPFEMEMRSFLARYMSWSAMKSDFADAYARAFTEPELLEITRYYQSPVGKKAAAKIPALMQTGMEIGQRHVQEHLPELQKILTEKMAAAEKK
jgi:hypothetical protein